MRAAATNFGCSQGGEAHASPQRAVRAEPTPDAAKRPAVRRISKEKADCLCCSLGRSPLRGYSLARAAPLSLFLGNIAHADSSTGSASPRSREVAGVPAAVDMAAECSGLVLAFQCLEVLLPLLLWPVSVSAKDESNLLLKWVDSPKVSHPRPSDGLSLRTR